mgnify:CR=1 FL=1
MDLTIPIENSFLNIRVAVLAKTKNGFLLEKNPEGYYYFIGGRIKINESSEEAAIRELFEETDFKTEKLIFKTVIENFFKLKDNKIVHEICFVYTLEEELIIKKLGSKQIEILVSDFENMDIKPKILKDYIISGDNRPHVIYKDFV